MTKPRLQTSRRLFLKGAGSIAIGLPFFEEFMPRQARAADGAMPCRLLTMSFGLGIEEALQNERFNGPLETFEPFADKTAFFTNVDGTPLRSGGTAHFRVAASTFTGVPQNGGNYHAGGPSMEQVMKRALHPNGVPNVSIPELSVGLWSRTGADSQFTRHWNQDGSPGQRPERRPSRVFDALFGSFEPPTGEPPDQATLLRNHVHRSVLDTVMEQYQSLSGPNSLLGRDSKARMQNHLDALRDSELQLAPVEEQIGSSLECDLPNAPQDPGGYSFYDAGNGATGNGAPEIDWPVAQQTMQLIGDLMAAGLACDALRFGSVVMIGGGGHVRFNGVYSALGESIDFDAVLGNGTPHDQLFHNYNVDRIRLYQHFTISQLTYMLGAMDAITEANGQTLLDNSLVLVGTEYGENHSEDHTFHALVGGGGRFNPGWYDQALIPSDVYHQALAAYDVDSGIPGRWNDYSPTEINGLRTV